MDASQNALLLSTAEGLVELSKNRDDMVIGVTAAVLDLYRQNIAKGADSKEMAVGRLRTQRDWLAKEVQDAVGVRFLGFLIDTLEADKLDAAKWLRLPIGGRG